jgi:hypothetical protein
MAFITVDQAISAARSAGIYESSVAKSEIRKSAQTPMGTEFGFFLSHSYEDARVISGVKKIVEAETGQSVYVDWIEDSQMSRTQVTAETADMLRKRMGCCRFMLYATSRASSDSKWMPWELGYFDGIKPGRIRILPVVKSGDEDFKGIEYLGLYPPLEMIDFHGVGERLGRLTGVDKGVRLATEFINRNEIF